MQDKMQQLEPDIEQWISSKLGKENVKAVSPKAVSSRGDNI